MTTFVKTNSYTDFEGICISVTFSTLLFFVNHYDVNNLFLKNHCSSQPFIYQTITVVKDGVRMETNRGYDPPDFLKKYYTSMLLYFFYLYILFSS